VSNAEAHASAMARGMLCVRCGGYGAIDSDGAHVDPYKCIAEFERCARLAAQMPSAPIRLNINDSVRVKPTALGTKVLESYVSDMDLPADVAEHAAKSIAPDVSGYVEMPLWKMAQIFGHRMGCGFDLVIETGIIVERRT